MAEPTTATLLDAYWINHRTDAIACKHVNQVNCTRQVRCDRLDRKIVNRGNRTHDHRPPCLPISPIRSPYGELLYSYLKYMKCGTHVHMPQVPLAMSPWQKLYIKQVRTSLKDICNLFIYNNKYSLSNIAHLIYSKMLWMWGWICGTLWNKYHKTHKNEN